MSRPYFLRGSGPLFVVLTATSFLLMLFTILQGSADDTPVTAAPSAYSASALGHRALVELLGESGFDVMVRRYRAVAPTPDAATDPDTDTDADSKPLLGTPNQTVLFAEPVSRDSDARAAGAFKTGVDAAPFAIVVLPKRQLTDWTAGEDERSPWLEEHVLVGTEEAGAVLDVVGLEATSILEPYGPTGSPDPGTSFEAEDGALFRVEVRGLRLLSEGDLEPLVWNADGILVGAAPTSAGKYRIVVSDADVFANHGLGRADHAALALWVFAQRGGRDRTVLIDELIHGFSLVPSLWKQLTSFPLGLALGQSLLAAAMLVWAGSARFGAPVPPVPPLEAGRRTLVDNTAELLLTGRHVGHSIQVYAERAVERVARVYRVHTRGTETAISAALDEVAERRNLDVRLATLLDDVRQLRRPPARGRRHEHSRRALRLARRIHIWQEEMLHGHRTDPRSS